MWELNEVLWGVYLFGLGIYDARNKHIKSWMLAIGGVFLLWSYGIGVTATINLMQGAVVGTVFVIVSYISKEKIGMGDALLIGILAMNVGLRDTIPILLTAFFMSAVVGVALLIAKFIKREQELAFLPYISIGYWIWQRLYTRHKGVYTVELACIMPLVLLIITGVIITAFYYHDKNILYGKVYEVGTIARQMYHDPEGVDTSQLDKFLEEKCKTKLLLFGGFEHDITVKDDEISIEASMQKGEKKIKISRTYHLNDMERIIRKIDPIE